jgi:hypothetical protein
MDAGTKGRRGLAPDELIVSLQPMFTSGQSLTATCSADRLFVIVRGPLGNMPIRRTGSRPVSTRHR